MNKKIMLVLSFIVTLVFASCVSVNAEQIISGKVIVSTDKEKATVNSHMYSKSIFYKDGIVKINNDCGKNTVLEYWSLDNEKISEVPIEFPYNYKILDLVANNDEIYIFYMFNSAGETLYNTTVFNGDFNCNSTCYKNSNVGYSNYNLDFDTDYSGKTFLFNKDGVVFLKGTYQNDYFNNLESNAPNGLISSYITDTYSLYDYAYYGTQENGVAKLYKVSAKSGGSYISKEISGYKTILNSIIYNDKYLVVVAGRVYDENAEAYLSDLLFYDLDLNYIGKFEMNKIINDVTSNGEYLSVSYREVDGMCTGEKYYYSEYYYNRYRSYPSADKYITGTNANPNDVKMPTKLKNVVGNEAKVKNTYYKNGVEYLDDVVCSQASTIVYKINFTENPKTSANVIFLVLLVSLLGFGIIYKVKKSKFN